MPTRRVRPPPAAESVKTAEDYAQLIADFVRSSGLLAADWETIFGQINQLLYGFMRWELACQAPRPGRVKPVKDPGAFIKRCEPDNGDLNSVPEIVNHWVTWFARWSLWVIPNRRLLGDAVDLARCRLLR